MKKTKIDLINLESGENPGEPVPAESAKAKEGEAPKAEKGKIPKKKKMILLGAGLLILLGAAAGGLALTGWLPVPGLSKKASPEAKAAPKQEIGPVVKMAPLIVNLREEGGRSYLKTTIALEVGKKEWVEAIQSKMSVLTDVAITTLSDKRLEDLKPPESKDKIKEELLTRMNQYLDPKKVARIYFDEFLYQ